MMTSIAAPVRASALLRGFNRFTENEWWCGMVCTPRRLPMTNYFSAIHL
jgi:hypothetical protein